jgi:hypothetical protein
MLRRLKERWEVGELRKEKVGDLRILSLDDGRSGVARSFKEECLVSLREEVERGLGELEVVGDFLSTSSSTAAAICSGEL